MFRKGGDGFGTAHRGLDDPGITFLEIHSKHKLAESAKWQAAKVHPMAQWSVLCQIDLYFSRARLIAVGVPWWAGMAPPPGC